MEKGKLSSTRSHGEAEKAAEKNKRKSKAEITEGAENAE